MAFKRADETRDAGQSEALIKATDWNALTAAVEGLQAGALRLARLAGVMPAAVGETVTLAHGLAVAQVLRLTLICGDVRAVVAAPAGGADALRLNVAGVRVTLAADGLTLSAEAAAFCLGQPFTALLVHWG